MHFGIDRTGLLGGLDIRDEGKGGRKDDIQVLESLNQRWCHLQRWARLGEKQVWGDEVGLSPLSHTQAWDKESSGVCQQSHRFVFVFKSSLCVLPLAFLIAPVVSGDSYKTQHGFNHSSLLFLLTSPSLSQQL